MSKTILLSGAIRFQAQWITKQHAEDGEWNPDKDEFGYSSHSTKKAAIKAAIAGSKKFCNEWFLVAEQQYQGYEWIDVRRWVGDWEGNLFETFRSEEEVAE